MATPDRAGRFAVSDAESLAANRSWWDEQSDEYLEEHGQFLGADECVWGPEGWREDELSVLGDLTGKRVLEFGGGAAQAGRWCRRNGAEVVSTDLSLGMLRAGSRLNRISPAPIPLVQCNAGSLPFGDNVFDVVFSAFGAVPFIGDSAGLMKELARVAKPSGIVAFSTSHPIRWAFPDVPTEAGLTISQSYFDTTAYAEAAGSHVTYAEHHRTMGERVRELLDAGLTLVDLRELPWKESNPDTWGGWSPLRGRLIPGTLILVGQKV